MAGPSSAVAFEVEEPPRASVRQVGDFSKQTIRVGLVAVFVLLGIQTLLVGGTVWVEGELLHLAREKLSTFGLSPEKPPSPGKPNRPGTCKAGLHSLSEEGLLVEFEEQHEAHKAGFATLWTALHAAELEANLYLEFPVELVNTTDGLLLSVGAVFASGQYAHMDALEQEHQPVLIFRQEDNEVVVKEQFMDWTMTQEEYKPLAQTRKPEKLRAQLRGHGLRVLQNCEVTSIIVDATLLITAGFFVSSEISSPSLAKKSVRAFDRNIDMTLTAAPSSGEDDVRFCLFRLPERPMPGRVADDRVGYFDVPSVALGDYRQDWTGRRAEELVNPSVRFIQRHRVRREDDSRAILIYVDHTVPKAYHEATRKGVERWQVAFEELGMGPVVRAVLPGDDDFPPDYDVADVRFSTISWADGGGDTFAIGQTVSDPRSGEILKANIVFALGWLEHWLGEALFFHAGIPMPMPRTEHGRRLAHREEKLRHLTVGHSNSTDFRPRGPALRHRHLHEDLASRAIMDPLPAVWLAQNQDKAAADEFLMDGIADVTSHEVGHILGLRHNFRGSTAVSFEDAQNAEFTGKHGLSASTMDYLDSNIMSQEQKSRLTPKKQPPHYFNPVIGAYDKWAIRYGYEEIEQEQETCCTQPPRLQEIAKEYATANFTFATDEDADWDGGVDPFTRRFDLTADPLLWHLDRLQLVQEMQEQLEERAVNGGESFARIADDETRLLRKAFLAACEALRFVGGVRVTRRHAACKDGEPCPLDMEAKTEKPLEAVSLEAQNKALSSVLEKFVAAEYGSTALPGQELQAYLLSRQPGSFLGLQPVDLHELVERLREQVLSYLLEPRRLRYVALSGRLLGREAWPMEVLQRISVVLRVRVLPHGDEGHDEGHEAKFLCARWRWPIQLAYVRKLAGLRDTKASVISTAFGLEVPPVVVQAAVQSELILLGEAIEKAEKSIEDWRTSHGAELPSCDSAEDATDPELLAFLALLRSAMQQE